MAKLRIEKLYGGFPQDYSSDSFGVEARSDQYTMSTGVNLFLPGYDGYLAPADIFGTIIADGGGVVNSLLRSSTTDVQSTTLPKTYMITGGLSGTAPKIIEENSSAVQTAVAISLASTASHGGHNFTTIASNGDGFWGQDTVIYKHNVGGTSTRSLLYAWNDNTDGDIGKIVLNSTTGSIGANDDDWMSTNATGGSTSGIVTSVPHIFAEGADLVLYFTNGQYVGSYDGNTGTNGTVNYSALNLGAGWVGVDIRRYKNYIAVACIQSAAGNSFTYESNNKIILWDGFSPDPNFVYEVTDSRLSAIFVANGKLFAFSDGKNNTTKAWKFNGAEFVKIAEALTSRIGSAPNPKCIEYYRGNLTWANSQYVVSLNGIDSNRSGIHLTMINNNGTDTSTSTGFIRNVEQGLLRASGLYNTTYSLTQNSLGAKFYASSPRIRTRLIQLPHRSCIKKMTVYFAQFGSGASVTLSLFKNKNTESIGGAADLLNKQLTATALGTSTESFSFETFIDDVDSFYMTITFDHASVSNTAAIIKAIEFEIEPTNAY